MIHQVVAIASQVFLFSGAFISMILTVDNHSIPPQNKSFASEFPISKVLVNRNDFGVSGTLLLSNTGAGLSNTRKGSPLENPKQELNCGQNKSNILQKIVSSII